MPLNLTHDISSYSKNNAPKGLPPKACTQKSRAIVPKRQRLKGSLTHTQPILFYQKSNILKSAFWRPQKTPSYGRQLDLKATHITQKKPPKSIHPRLIPYSASRIPNYALRSLAGTKTRSMTLSSLSALFSSITRYTVLAVR